MRLITFLRQNLYVLIVAFGVFTVNSQVERRLPQNFSLQINGQVRYAETKRPAENVLVRIERFSGGLVSQITTDRTGKFSFNNLSPVQYIITVHLPGFLDVRENVNLATANSGYLNVELVKDKTSTANANAGRAEKFDLSALPVINANIPFAAQTEFEKGKLLLNTGNQEKFAEAAKYLEKAVQIYPKYFDAQILLGLVYADLQKWSKAERPLIEAVAIKPDVSAVYFVLGEVYRREKKYADAQKVLLEGIKLDENSAASHNTLAKVFWERVPAEKDEQKIKIYLESAWQEVNRAMKLDPNLAEAHLLAGNLLLRARRAPDALVHFEQYLKLDPNGEFAAPTAELVKKIKKAINEK